MLGKKNKESGGNLGANLLNIIGAGTSVKGDISSEGDLRVDGKIEGNVAVKKRLVLGKGAVITGDVDATNAIITGDIHGAITVADTLLLKETCIIEGDLKTNKLIIESGAQFNGKCSMNITEKAHSNKENGKQAAKGQ